MPQDAGLARRFLTDWPAPFSPPAASVYDAPSRQRQLIAIGRQQLEAQRSAAKEIASSHLDAADIVVREIRQQTVSLEASLRDYSELISADIMDATERMSTAIDDLGDRLCVCLDEIRWQLEQQEMALTGILRTLRHNRSNEARQLVEQGIRHYINEQYERAEERFRQALVQDTTDYQVLMNLGLIAVQKERSAEALELFRDALRLPSALDNTAKNRALHAIARLHYARGEYQDALVVARQAMDTTKTTQGADIFRTGNLCSPCGPHERLLGLFGKGDPDPPGPVQ